jgi:plastocyanin
MKKAIIVNAIFIVLVIGFIVFLEILHARLNPAPLTNSKVNIKQVLSQDKVDSFITADTISINTTSFSPSSLTVKINDKVTWLNNDSVAHTLQFTSGSTSKVTIQPHSIYSMTMTQPTTYTYNCSGAAGEVGTITVTDPNFTALKHGG